MGRSAASARTSPRSGERKEGNNVEIIHQMGPEAESTQRSAAEEKEHGGGRGQTISRLTVIQMRMRG